MPMYLLIIFAVVLLDQLVKFFVRTQIPVNVSYTLVPHILSVTHVQNYGAAWSLLLGHRIFFLIFTVIALSIMIYFFRDLWHNWGYALGISLMIGGTLGNFIDRLVVGYVVDMFKFKFIQFPIFNIADIALTFGVIVVLLTVMQDDAL